MFSINNSIKLTSYLIFIFLISGCGSIKPVKDIAGDKIGYLSKNFSGKSVESDVAKALPKNNSAPVNFREINVDYSIETELSNGTKDISDSTAKNIPLGDGMVQRLIEHSRNGIASMLLFNVGYKGILNLRWQVVPLQANFSSQVFELKKITRLDPIPDHVNEQFVMEYETGSEQQLGGFSPCRYVCNITNIGEANSIEAKLHGKATYIDCESFVNNALSSRAKWILLNDYEVALMRETTTTSTKTAYKIKTITVD